MNIAIIGAGMAGLSAAWSLRDKGHQICIFERNYKAGGRVNSRRKAGLVMDHGDRFFEHDASVMEELIWDCGLKDDLRPITLPIFKVLADGSYVESPEYSDTPPRLTFADGMLMLPEALRRQLGGYYSIRVMAVTWDEIEENFVLRTEPPLRAQETHFPAVIVATPAPEALQLVEPVRPLLHAAFLEKLERVEYTRCFTLMAALTMVDLPKPFFGIEPDPSRGSLLQWLAFEDRKCEGREGAGWSAIVAHATPQASEKHWKLSDEKFLGKLYRDAREMVPQLPAEWRWARAKRWDLSRLKDPDNLLSPAPDAVAPDGVLLEFCGDYRVGDGCEEAARSGREAAEILVNKIAGLPPD